jgi:hypothetical protein
MRGRRQSWSGGQNLAAKGKLVGARLGRPANRQWRSHQTGSVFL